MYDYFFHPHLRLANHFSDTIFHRLPDFAFTAFSQRLFSYVSDFHSNEEKIFQQTSIKFVAFAISVVDSSFVGTKLVFE